MFQPRPLVMSSALACTVAAGLAHAADHREAPLIWEDLTADIADVYAYLSPMDDGRVVLAMTVNSFTAPSENTTFVFSPNVRYNFLIDNTGDAREDVTISVTFAGPDLGPQDYEVRVSGVGKYSQPFVGAATPPTLEPDAAPPIITDGPGGITAFAGQRDDSFIFDVVGFNRFLAGTGTFSGADGFAGYNVSAIVLEVPLDLLEANDGGGGDDDGDDDDGDDDDGDDDDGGGTTISGDLGGLLQVWGTTERRRRTIRRSSKGKLEMSVGPWEQIDRMGNPAISTALIPAPLKNIFNIGEPADDAMDFASSIVDSLQALGTDEKNIGILASVAVPDTLKLDPTMPSGFPNGRRPQDDVIDTLLFFIFNQTSVSDGANMNDMPFLDAFPYLPAPHQPR